ncbi:MAG: DUF4411 family protein [Spirochaetaceae bacterium]|nr:DUF4411 family protein [Spirochaetaceae bacterium]
MDPTYVVDSDVFITAKNLYYSFDICPGFWKSVVHHHLAGRVFSVDRARSELLAGHPAEEAKFATGADGWLVAYARVHRAIVVTNEQSAPESRREIKLPDVCDQFEVKHENTFAMLRALNVSFDWARDG